MGGGVPTDGNCPQPVARATEAPPIIPSTRPTATGRTARRGARAAGVRGVGATARGHRARRVGERSATHRGTRSVRAIAFGACAGGVPQAARKQGDAEISRVEEGRGSLGHPASLRLPSPLIKPDVRISRIRLSDWLLGRLTTLRPIGGTGVVSSRRVPRRPPPCGRVRCCALASCGAGRESSARGHTDGPRSPGPWSSGSRG